MSVAQFPGSMYPTATMAPGPMNACSLAQKVSDSPAIFTLRCRLPSEPSHSLGKGRIAPPSSCSGSRVSGSQEASSSASSSKGSSIASRSDAAENHKLYVDICALGSRKLPDVTSSRGSRLSFSEALASACRGATPSEVHGHSGRGPLGRDQFSCPLAPFAMREAHRRSAAGALVGALAGALLAAAAVCALVVASPRHQLSSVLLGGDDWLGAPFAGEAKKRKIRKNVERGEC